MGRIKASFTHFLISAVVVVTAMLVVFFVWYPRPYSNTNNVLSIVKILVAVDLVLGPLLTFVVFNTKKPFTELRRDLAIIATIQIAALSYGLYTLHKERPVFVVFASDRMDVITGSEIDISKIDKSVAHRPWLGPTLAYALPGQDNEDKEALLFEVLDGKPDIDRRPERYRPFDHNLEMLRSKTLFLDDIVESAKTQQKEKESTRLSDYVRSMEKSSRDVFFLPLKGKIKSMVTVHDSATGLPLESFDIIPWPAYNAATSRRETASVDDPDADADLDVSTPAAE